jgi:hypothetical protein
MQPPIDCHRAVRDTEFVSTRMEALPRILQSMQLSLIAIAALVAFGFFTTTLMLFRQSKVLRDSEIWLRETHALIAKASAALDNVTQLVVHPGGRP